MDVGPFVPQESHCFCAIRRDVQVDMHIGVFKRLPREPDIAIALTKIDRPSAQLN
jgi:hypothetical protein